MAATAKKVAKATKSAGSSFSSRYCKKISYEAMAHYDSKGILTGVVGSHFVDITLLDLPANFNFSNILLTELRHAHTDELIAVSPRYLDQKLIFAGISQPKTLPYVKIIIPLYQPNNDPYEVIEEAKDSYKEEKRPKLKPRGIWSRKSSFASDEVKEKRNG